MNQILKRYGLVVTIMTIVVLVLQANAVNTPISVGKTVATVGNPTAAPVNTAAPAGNPTAAPVNTAAPVGNPTAAPVNTAAPVGNPTASPGKTVAPLERNKQRNSSTMIYPGHCIIICIILGLLTVILT